MKEKYIKIVNDRFSGKTREILLKQILNNKYIEIKDTEEYLNYYGYGNEKVEYYD